MPIELKTISSGSVENASDASHFILFIDSADSAIKLKDSSGTVTSVGGGLTYFDDAESTSSPNDTVYVSSLTAVGAATDVDFVISPKGTGAILRQTPDGTSTGGNKRGAYAIDFQITRSTSTEVASGNYSALLGGYANTASASYSAVVCGTYNIANGDASFIGGGSSNQALGESSFIGGGISNTIYSGNAVICGGYNNVCSGSWSVIGGGWNNYCSGRSSVIGGGSYNITNIANIFQTIGGGYSNSCSGDYTTVGGGLSNVCSGNSSIIGGGSYNATDINHTDQTIGGGYNNNCSGIYSAILGGHTNKAWGSATAIIGGFGSQTQSPGELAFSTGNFSDGEGKSQWSNFVINARTTDDTTTDMKIDTSGYNMFIGMAANQAFAFDILVVAKDEGSTDCAGYHIRGIKRQGSIIGTPIIDVLGESDSSWDVGIYSGGDLIVQVTGAASTNIRWVAHCRIAKVGT